MVWVTRTRLKIDRIACPWLIRRLVDLRAVILFVAPPRWRAWRSVTTGSLSTLGGLQSMRQAVQLRRDVDGVRPPHRRPASAVVGPARLMGDHD
ncbi:chromate resistance protein ChrB domain-containing protein [Paracoccus sp. SY]|uniref:chromate resistance protein ChrB domain-containing protein n=1 Tax=Paracoccus TaxID=265 RepID=UPI001EFDC76E|nr:chromate resistance protein ChrB domain-containing protein [Paracoccus sp. SY]